MQVVIDLNVGQAQATQCHWVYLCEILTPHELLVLAAEVTVDVSVPYQYALLSQFKFLKYELDYDSLLYGFLQLFTTTFIAPSSINIPVTALLKPKYPKWFSPTAFIVQLPGING